VSRQSPIQQTLSRQPVSQPSVSGQVVPFTSTASAETEPVAEPARVLMLGERRIADDEPCCVIAEIGHNHCGSVDIARKMIEIAADCGAAAVKLQKRDTAAVYTAAFLKRPYEHDNSYGRTYGEHREALELTTDAYRACQDVASRRGLLFMATAFDERSAAMLADLKVPAIKIASGDLTNTPLLRFTASLGLPMIVSTGGGTDADIDRAVNAILPANRQLALLHCTASYPCAFDELNLQCIVTLRERYPELVIGWSGHDSGIAMAVMAYTLGARIIEKHFTLNRANKGADHAFSLEPTGLRKLVRDLDRAKVARGDGQKVRYASEHGPLTKMGKSLVAAIPLAAGHTLRREDLLCKSPAGGLPPYQIDQIVGKRLARSVDADQTLTTDDISSEVA